MRTASADVPTAGLVPFTTALAARGGVPQLAAAMRQAIVDPRVRRDDSRTTQGVRGRATRTLAVVAQTEVAGYGTVTVVEQRPTYSAVAADGALLVVPPPVGTDPGSSSDRPRVVALGISPGGFTRGGWTAGDWLPPRATGGLPEPLTYLAVGRATGAAGASVRELEVRIGERRVIGKTSLVLVSGQQLSGIDPKARPYSLVVGTLDDGFVMQPLVSAEVQ